MSRCAFTMLAVVAGGAVALPLLGPTERQPDPAVDASVRVRALAASVPERPTMSDEIGHFVARATARPEESFAKERLFSAHMLAFRAYGDPLHLNAAAEIVTELSGAAALRSEASVRLAEHDFSGALEAAETLATTRSDEGARYPLFDALWAVGDKAEAAEILDGTLDTLSTAYLSRRARVVDGAGFTEPARDIFRRVVDNVHAYAEPAPVRAWALVELGHFELHAGDPDAAVDRYLEALDVLPGNPAALEGLGSVAYGVDRELTVARGLYAKALENGGHLDVMPTLADIEDALGNEPEATRLRQTFVSRALEDRRSETMYRRPLIFVLSETPATRIEAVRQARLDLRARQDQGAFDALAWALFRTGNIGMAWILEERALAAGGPPPSVLYRAGLIADAAGETDRAAVLLTEALDGRVELAPHEVSAAVEALQRQR